MPASKAERKASSSLTTRKLQIADFAPRRCELPDEPVSQRRLVKDRETSVVGGAAERRVRAELEAVDAVPEERGGHFGRPPGRFGAFAGNALGEQEDAKDAMRHVGAKEEIPLRVGIVRQGIPDPLVELVGVSQPLFQSPGPRDLGLAEEVFHSACPPWSDGESGRGSRV